MNRATFDQRIAELVDDIGDRQLDDQLAGDLNARYGPDSTWYAAVREACLAAVTEGWMCDREAGGIRYGRVTRPGDSAGAFSVDVVSMEDCRGPYHVHPAGEIDLVMPLAEGARFDGQGAGWKVYPAGSGHYPTVDGGAALVLYLLPGGRIDFTRPA